ncbi:Oidioi.mRNA.OKI2018_I69.PAR.g8564.t1.cds [Oikopleura dioica]|uniref:Oidioi.mRNA.OKI2018_I69.PAR.g8564.t1.cds n=1 Tax=Oikopleura dioica TaxID=34765 RepID=A0ABN7RHL5_OIKDI|nr:Oidioi.mRNA.OKI2018_I69.PAR.g8564.t1.cds [Oikopleura dioica]
MIFYFLTTFTGIFGDPPAPPCENLDKCAYSTGEDVVKHKTYTGTISTTRSGRTCQKWSAQYPHQHSMNEMFVESYGEQDLDTNYCRNPDNMEDGAWCYTTDSNKRWEYCDIPACDCVSFYSGNQANYEGKISVTESGKKCDVWVDMPDGFDGTNYCRNTDGEPRAWCFSEESDGTW